MTAQQFLNLAYDFNHLSLPDLLLARDHFHLHLSHKANVVATAIGYYRIRKSDPWPTPGNPQGGPPPSARAHPPRTLENSEVRPYSWPAIMVFVDRWQQPGEFANPEDAVPPAVYMPNGQKVPICVVQVDKDEMNHEGDAHYSYPASVMGGGYPVICDVQGKEHIASVACLVTDGHRVFALTNRHVAGDAGEPIAAIVGNNKERIGLSAPLALKRKLFTELYTEWPGKNVYVDLDVGLIDLDDLERWTTQVYGIGEIGPLADLDASTITLRLIGCPVRAHGAASGPMNGEICALFYRFKSVGGFDYVADVLIGPTKERPLGTHPGDSGTLWLIDDGSGKEEPRPIALQWGGQVFLDAEKQGSSYALATFLSTVCAELDLTVLRDWNTGLPEYWGAVGHYGIANKACDVIRNRKLKELMDANLERISFDLSDINKKQMAGLSLRDFVPLADVPDMVWKVGPFKRGGMKAPEHANHFADMDRELDPPLPEGATLLAICKGKPQNVAVDVWRRYYDQVKKQHPDQEESRGLLPFRVWQIYDAMVSAVRGGDVQTFVCAAGILSHYVGDSCQPLHISYMFNGDPDHTVAGTDPKTHQPADIPVGHGVHSAYEDDMVDRHVQEIFSGVDARLARNAKPPLVTGGHAAAVAVVELMQKTFDAIAPQKIVDEFVKVQDDKPAARADALWSSLGDDTIDVMADGCFCLAQLWDSAWEEGNGDLTVNSLGAISEADLEHLYQNPNFLPSHTLDTIGPLLQGAPAPAAGGHQPARPRARTHAPAQAHRVNTPKRRGKQPKASKPRGPKRR
jgi:hypothetical protein